MDAKKTGKAKRLIINLLLTLLIGLVYFYFKLPALNLQDPQFYTFIILLAAVFCVLSILSMGLHKASSGRELWMGIRKNCLPPVLIVAGLVVIFLVGSLISAPIFRAAAYHPHRQQSGRSGAGSLCGSCLHRRRRFASGPAFPGDRAGSGILCSRA